MIDEIRKELKGLEEEKNIKILYAVESGSRAWGFASKDSDWDVRFMYVHTMDWYLSIQDKKDSIEIIKANDIDLGGWELRKALLLFRKSNPPLLEWLRSPIIYKDVAGLAEELRKVSKNYFNPKSCLYHYYHMAKGNFEAYFKDDLVRLKKYLYVLRPLLACEWISRKNNMAPMEFDLLVKAEIENEEIKFSLNQLLDKKKSGEELDKGEHIKPLDEFICNKLNYYNEFLKEFEYSNTPDFETLNKIFRRTLNEAWN